MPYPQNHGNFVEVFKQQFYVESTAKYRGMSMAKSFDCEYIILEIGIAKHCLRAKIVGMHVCNFNSEICCLHDKGAFASCTCAVILNRHHHLPEVETHRSVPLAFRSDQPFGQYSRKG